MTFEQWQRKHAWHVADESMLSMMRLAYNAGHKDGSKAIRAAESAKRKRTYLREKANGICPRCKQKHDGTTIYCDPCKVQMKIEKDNRKARKLCRLKSTNNGEHVNSACNVAGQAESRLNAGRAD